MAQAVPAHLIAKLLSEISDDTEIKPPDDTKPMAEIIASAKLVNRKTDDTSYTPVYDDGDGGLTLGVRKTDDD